MTAYTASNPVPMPASPTTNGIVQQLLVDATNTGSSTYAPDGLGAAPIFGLGGEPLQGDEMVANGIATLVSYIGPLMNAGALCWILVDCAGGAEQIAPATQSQHAVQLGQIANLVGGRLTRTTVYSLIDNVVNASINGGPVSPMSTFSTQPETTMWEVEGEGSGGGSGGVAAVPTDPNGSRTSGGGASGSYGWSIFTVAATNVPVTIGAPGSGGGAGDNGGNGGTVSLGSLLILPGGQGSPGLSAAVFNPAGGLPGAAPTGANVMGFPGEGGGSGSLFSTGGADVLAFLLGGKGGSGKFGCGAQAQAAFPSEGKTGSGFGAGASGASVNGGSGAAGAAGTAGVLVIREYS